jgi:hypothetical protein
MKFRVIWEIHPDKRQEVMSVFAGMELADYKAASGPGIKIIGRWHDVMNMTGVVICEADDAEAIASWVTQWHTVCDFDLVPVLEDEEAHALAREMYPGG